MATQGASHGRNQGRGGMVAAESCPGHMVPWNPEGSTESCACLSFWRPLGQAAPPGWWVAGMSGSYALKRGEVGLAGQQRQPKHGKIPWCPTSIYFPPFTGRSRPLKSGRLHKGGTDQGSDRTGGPKLMGLAHSELHWTRAASMENSPCSHKRPSLKPS